MQVLDCWALFAWWEELEYMQMENMVIKNIWSGIMMGVNEVGGEQENMFLKQYAFVAECGTWRILECIQSLLWRTNADQVV